MIAKTTATASSAAVTVVAGAGVLIGVTGVMQAGAGVRVSGWEGLKVVVPGQGAIGATRCRFLRRLSVQREMRPRLTRARSKA